MRGTPEARLVADHSARAARALEAVALEAVAHRDARWFALNRSRRHHFLANSLARFVQLSCQSTVKGGVGGTGSDFRPKTTHSLRTAV